MTEWICANLGDLWGFLQVNSHFSSLISSKLLRVKKNASYKVCCCWWWVRTTFKILVQILLMIGVYIFALFLLRNKIFQIHLLITTATFLCTEMFIGNLRKIWNHMGEKFVSWNVMEIGLNFFFYHKRKKAWKNTIFF